MRARALAAALLAAAPAGADELSLGGTEDLRPAVERPRKKAPAAPPSDELKAENWSSFSMEATAIVGEMRYMERDFSGAKEKFRDSLSSSLKVADPHGRFVALDLFRTAELAARERNFPVALRHLEILLQRYPDSEWAERAKELLKLIPKGTEPAPDPEEQVPVIPGGNPEGALRRIQSALKAARDEDAARECRAFLERYADHAAAEEARLALGAVLLRRGRPREAEAALSPLAALPKGETRAKAEYLLGAARYLLGDADGVRAAVAEAPAPWGGRWAVLAQLWRAAADEMDGRSDAAATRYRRVARAPFSSPLKAYAHAALAAQADRQGRRAEAESGLRQAAADAERWGLGSLAAAARLGLGHVLYKMRRLPAAATAYADFIRRFPEHADAPRAGFQRGLALKRAGRTSEAAAAFKDLVARYPDSELASDAHLQLGQVYTAMGRGQQAIEYYQGMARAPGAKDGAQKESLLLVAQVHYNAKRYREAIPHYWKFLERFGDDAKAREVEELLLTSYWAGAREDPDLHKAVARFPDHPIVAHIRLELGRRAYREGDFEKAQAQLERLAADFPRSSGAAEALALSGECSMKLGRPARAAEAFRDLKARYPSSPQARAAQFRLGTALFESGDFEGSQQAYAQVQGGGTLAADALFNRALAFEKAGRKGSALSAYEQLLTRFPSYPQLSWVWMQVAQLREAHGRYAPAADAWGRVSDPAKRALALLAQGRCWERLKRRDKAKAAYERMEALRPREDAHRLNGLLRLGLLREVSGDRRGALPLYAEVARLGSGAAAQTAQSRLDALSGARPSRPLADAAPPGEAAASYPEPAQGGAYRYEPPASEEAAAPAPPSRSNTPPWGRGSGVSFIQISAPSGGDEP